MTPGVREAIKPTQDSANEDGPSKSFRRLLVLGLMSLFVYSAILWISPQFNLNVPGQARPIPLMLGLFAAAFALYVFAIWNTTQIDPGIPIARWIIGFAIAFRLLLLFSPPIQEVDLHRYVWDGVVSSQGISPFRYTPNQVLAASPTDSNSELRRLARIRDSDTGLRSILEQLSHHFGYLPTVYPPTSQAVFALAAKTTPHNASYATRVRIMKSWLLMFDIGVVFILVKLLRLCNKPIGLSIAYAWCPLVIKEVANSGHLDSIAVFLSTLAVYGLVKSRVIETDSEKTSSNLWRLPATALVLAAAVGAKIYPIVLAPLVVVASVRYFGWKRTILPAFVFVVTTVVLVWPLIPGSETRKQAQIAPHDVSQQASTKPSDGITTFVKYWEMNDFLFMVAVENLKPTIPPSDAGERPPPKVWFSVVPESTRRALVEPIAAEQTVFNPSTQIEQPMDTGLASFLIIRGVTSLLFLTLAVGFAWKFTANDPAKFCEGVFLTLAWFWLLSPTQNPWYWMWALPMLPFVKNRAWYAMSGLVLIYYLRFWFDYNFADAPVAGTCYAGASFFDFVITWFEYGPWFLWLAIESVMNWLRSESRIEQ